MSAPRFGQDRRIARPAQTAQRGWGLVELMVGITVGLLVAVGAVATATRQISEHRRLLLEVQLQQDLRTVAELLQRELRRAGFRGQAAHGVWEPPHTVGAALVPAKAASASPYETVTQSAAGKDLFYRYARTSAAGAMNTSNQVAANEEFGFRLNNRVLYLQLGAPNGQPNWQPLTDPDLLVVDDFTVAVDRQPLSLADLCLCPPNTPCPTLTVRRVDITLRAHAAADPALQRTVQVSERLRVDESSGSCP